MSMLSPRETGLSERFSLLFNKLTRSDPMVIALLVVLLGAFFRLILFDLMEFKYDEVTALALTRHWLSQGLPQYGLVSGVGVRNPPGLIYLLIPPLLVTSSPLAVALYIAFLNIAAIFLLFKLGNNLGVPTVGLWAGAFTAVHPWLILYSRKIWAQSLLPFFICLLLIVVAHCMQCPRSRAVFWIAPLLCITWQLHYSAFSVVVFSALWFSVEAARRRVDWMGALAGMALGMVMLLPFGRYLAKTEFKDVNMSLKLGQGVMGLEEALEVLKTWVNTSFSCGLGHLFKIERSWLSEALPDRGALAFDVLAVAGTGVILALIGFGVFSGFHDAEAFSTASRFRFWLLLFVLLPLSSYLIKGIRTPPHYFIVSLPASMILAGFGMERLGAVLRSRRTRGSVILIRNLAGLAVLVSGSVVWLYIILQIHQAGGTGGGYGLSYRVQKQTAKFLIQERISLLKTDTSMTRDRSIGIMYLARLLSDECEPEAGKPAMLIDTLLYPHGGCDGGKAGTRAEKIGPMVVCPEPSPDGVQNEKTDSPHSPAN